MCGVNCDEQCSTQKKKTPEYLDKFHRIKQKHRIRRENIGRNIHIASKIETIFLNIILHIG